jgi:hypothetical protein
MEERAASRAEATELRASENKARFNDRGLEKTTCRASPEHWFSGTDHALDDLKDKFNAACLSSVFDGDEGVRGGHADEDD